jgi:splicing factor U2AF subunit
MSLTGGKRKENKSLKAWVAFVKRVQKEEKIASYKDAIHRAKQRKDKGEKWMRGGENTTIAESEEEMEGEQMRGEEMEEKKIMEENKMGGIILGGKRKSMRRRNVSRTRKRSLRMARGKSARRSRGRSRRRSRGRH